MNKTAAAFRGAWQDYRQHFRALFCAAALLNLPTTAIVLIRRLLAEHTQLPLPSQGTTILAIVGEAVGLVSLGAVALLAADLRAGGTWGWREGWARALARIRPILTGLVVGGAVLALPVAAIFMPIVVFALGAELGPGAPSTALATGAWLAFFVLGWTLLGLLPMVSSIERVGGLRAGARTWRLLRQALPLGVLTVGLAQSLLIAPHLVLMLAPIDGAATQALASLVATFLTPFVVLVNVTVYGELRDVNGAGAAQLRADLDAP